MGDEAEHAEAEADHPCAAAEVEHEVDGVDLATAVDAVVAEAALCRAAHHEVVVEVVVGSEVVDEAVTRFIALLDVLYLRYIKACLSRF